MSDADLTLLYLLKQVELAVRSTLDDVVRDLGLTSVQYTALTVLERHPGMTSAALARNSFVRAQSMAQMVGYLDGLGFISRERDPNSNRQFLLSLTPKGQQALNDLRDSVADIEHRMTQGISSARLREIRATLHSFRESLGGNPVQ